MAIVAGSLAAASLFGAGRAQAQTQPWMDTTLTPAERAALLLAAMSEAQELQMVGGLGGSYVGDVPGIAALDIPALNLEDGPAGVADRVTGVTVFPAPITVAASWDTALAGQFAVAMGQEQVAKGTNIVLGPMMNMDRVPQGGRNFEGFGEDPVLASAMAAAIVTGIQSEGLIATAKHYVGNEQETNRTTMSAIIDDRTLHEIYIPPFAASVAAGAGAVMCSYNEVNYTFACENPATLTHWLKGELGFQGFVMSDWTATHSTVASANAGLDMEMPDLEFFADLGSAISQGAVARSRLDDMVTRILTSMFAAGLFDRAPSGSITADAETADHTALARAAAAQGTVLLANDGVLPIGSAVQTIAVIGTAASTSPVYQGLGSSMVQASAGAVVTPLAGITARASGLTVAYDDGTDSASATALASSSDVAVVVVGVTSSEGSDRATLSLPAPDDDLVTEIADVNPHTIVVVYAPAQITMPWASFASAILFGGLPGQEEGDALADVLFGDVNPSGKLPMTIAAEATDYPASTAAQFPGIGQVAMYSEGFLVGYRAFDASGTSPVFPFGHGLSYTTFGYANLAVTPAAVSPADSVSVALDVTNTGSVAGAEVVQLYLGMPALASEPPAQLEAFQKVSLDPGATAHVTFAIDPSMRTFWSAGLEGRATAPGTYGVAVGSSSRDIRLRGSFDEQGGPLAGAVHQAEDAALCCGAAASTSQTGFTGSGFVTGFADAGASAAFTVTMPAAQSCAVTARYSAAMTAAAAQAPYTLSLYVNGTKIKQVTFPPLANFDTWDFESETVDLLAGANTIAYTQDPGDTGDVNLDAVLDCLGADEGGDAGVDGAVGEAGAVDAAAPDATSGGSDAAAPDDATSGGADAAAPDGGVVLGDGAPIDDAGEPADGGAATEGGATTDGAPDDASGGGGDAAMADGEAMADVSSPESGGGPAPDGGARDAGSEDAMASLDGAARDAGSGDAMASLDGSNVGISSPDAGDDVGSGDGSGCGCATVGARPVPSGFVALSFLLPMAIVRRRVRAKRGSRRSRA